MNPQTIKFIYSNLMLMVLLLLSFSNAAQTIDSIPLHETFTLKSEIVSETRTINIWTPPGYRTSKNSFPVLYMADGGIKEDFPHLANTIAALIKSKQIKPIILVGIENTQRRRDLTGFTAVPKDKEIAPVVGGAEKFRAFINDELFAEINKRYRTTKEKTIIGESLAGLFVIETFLLKPAMFDQYIAFDPSLWWNNNELVKTAKKYLAKHPSIEKKLWFAGSGEESISIYTKELASILKKQNLPNLKWQYVDQPNEEHGTIFRATKEKAIKWIFGKR